MARKKGRAKPNPKDKQIAKQTEQRAEQRMCLRDLNSGLHGLHDANA